MQKELEAVRQIIKKYKTADPFDIAERMGFLIEKRPLGSLRAFYRISRRNKFITLNSTLNDYQKRVECAHELGHYVLHKEYNTFMLSSIGQSSARFEKEADRFAVYLLLSQYSKCTFENCDIYQISAMTGIEPYRLKLIYENSIF